jgi:hypothetical protein
VRVSSLILSVAAVLVGVGCGEPPPEAEPDAGGPVTQGSEARGELVINEVAPRPLSGEDWIELYNRSDSALDLCDYFVTDSLDRLDHYLPLGGVAPPDSCEPRMLGAGEYLIVWADDEVTAGIDHAPFHLGVADEAHVVHRTGAAVDSLLYLYRSWGADAGSSLARVPNGEGVFYFATPSAGAPNPEVVP